MSDQFKQQAAEAAVELIESGMTLGLGHGSTVQFALEALTARIRSGSLKNIVAVPASRKTETEMGRLGIPIGDLNRFSSLDLTIDGADEVDPDLNLIKGGGGALMREKIVAQASRRNVIIVTEEKLSAMLGTKHALPVEVAAFGWEVQQQFISEIGGKPKLRIESNGKPALSDQGNFLLDCEMGPIDDLFELARKLESRAGIIEHGLFLNLATDVIVAGAKGVQHLKAKSS